MGKYFNEIMEYFGGLFVVKFVNKLKCLYKFI